MSDKIRESLAGLLAIVDDSEGVAGYHLNGAIAEWHDFAEVDAAREALAEAQPAPEQAEQQELASIEAMVGMLEGGEWAEHVGQLGGPIAQRLEREITRLHNEQAEQDAVTVPRELLELYLSGGGDWVEAGHKLRDLLGGDA